MTGAAARLRRGRAVLVGIEQYGSDPTLYLNGPASDAARMARWFADHGLPREAITLLVAPVPGNADRVRDHAGDLTPVPATRDALYAVFSESLRADEGDLLFVYWAGHGYGVDQAVRLVCPPGADDATRGLDLADLRRWLRTTAIRFPVQRFFVDCCRQEAGDLGLSGDAGLWRFDPGTEASERDQETLLATSPGQVSTNLPGTRSTWFGGALRAALADLPDGAPPTDLRTLFDAIVASGDRPAGQSPTMLEYRSSTGPEAEHRFEPAPAPAVPESAWLEVAGLLAKVSTMEYPENRRRLIRELERRLGGGFGLHLDSGSVPDVWEICIALGETAEGFVVLRALVHGYTRLFPPINRAVRELASQLDGLAGAGRGARP